jgi:hypothetical protein
VFLCEEGLNCLNITWATLRLQSVNSILVKGHVYFEIIKTLEMRFLSTDYCITWKAFMT